MRVLHLTSDIPRRIIDEKTGIQKYKPNQSGYWRGGDHKWQTNDFGYPGPAPMSKDNLITIIGDSFIENFMNPDSCHQSQILKKLLPQYDYYEAARSGISFIEAIYIAENLDEEYHPLTQLIFINNSDMTESIREIKQLDDITQLSLDESKVYHGEMKSPRLKLVLYNWKLAHYSYIRIKAGNEHEKKQRNLIPIPHEKIHLDKVESLLHYSTNNFDLSNIVLVFFPDFSGEYTTLFEKANIKFIQLVEKSTENWTFDHDAHWTCNGHRLAAAQIYNYFVDRDYLLLSHNNNE